MAISRILLQLCMDSTFTSCSRPARRAARAQVVMLKDTMASGNSCRGLQHANRHEVQSRQQGSQQCSAQTVWCSCLNEHLPRLSTSCSLHGSPYLPGCLPARVFVTDRPDTDSTRVCKLVNPQPWRYPQLTLHSACRWQLLQRHRGGAATEAAAGPVHRHLLDLWQGRLLESPSRPSGGQAGARDLVCLQKTNTQQASLSL